MVYQDAFHRLSEAFKVSRQRVFGPKVIAAKNIILYGVSERTAGIIDCLKAQGRIPTQYLFENENDKGENIKGIEKISIEQIPRFDSENTVVLFSKTNISLMKNFIENGFSCFDFEWITYPAMFNEMFIMESLEEIMQAYDILEDAESKDVFLSVLEYRITANPLYLKIAYWPQYFHPTVRPEAGDVIVDGGGFIGDTAESFIRYLNGNCRIHSFEPDSKNDDIFSRMIEKNKWEQNIVLNKRGLWGTTGKLSFSNQGTSSSRINEAGDSSEENSINVIDIDTYFFQKEEKPTLIKLDVERAEYETIHGARNSISLNLPKLQICAYHNPWDLWRIPMVIHEMGLPYKLFLGHHMLSYCETVLYAQPMR
jgi:methyltransferase, FkbM family